MWSRAMGLSAVALSLWLSGTGCGSNKGCEDYARASCSKQAQCSDFQALYVSANVEACVGNVLRTCELSARSPDATWTAETAAQCASAYGTATCDDILSGNIPQACRAPGKRAIGAPCGDAFQCASSYCKKAQGSRCGTCTDLAKDGQSCSSVTCDYGLRCINGTCGPYRSEGEACDGQARCKPSLACMQGFCRTPMLGGSCAAQTECSFNKLQYCSAASLTCQTLPWVVAKVGDACGDGADAIVDCEYDAYCRSTGSTSFGVCTKLPGEGQACADGLCSAPLTCIDQICKVFDRATCG